MEERSVTIYKLFIDANNKFDQFILAMLVTLLTYLMTTIQLAPIGLNSSTVALVSLIFIGLAVFLALKELSQTLLCNASIMRLCITQRLRIATGPKHLKKPCLRERVLPNPFIIFVIHLYSWD